MPMELRLSQKVRLNQRLKTATKMKHYLLHVQIMKPLSLCLLFLAMAALPGCSSDSSRGYSKTAYKQGIADAKAEIAKGSLALETFGLQAGGGSVYQQHLKDKYGIELRVVAGCVIDYEILGHARGFNEVMKAEIEKKWPQDVFKEAEEKTRQKQKQ